MTREWKRCSAGLVLVALILVAGCATTTVREHPLLARGERPTLRLLLLPPDVVILRKAFEGDNARLEARENATATYLTGTLRGLLNNRGYVIQVLDPETVADTPMLKLALAKVRSGYQSASAQLYRRRELPTDRRASMRTSLGPVANRLATYADADALLLVRSRGYEKSSGRVAKNASASPLAELLRGSSGSANASLDTELALIDGTTGDVLWTNAQQRAGGAVLAPDATALLTSFPRPRQRLVAANTKPAVKASPDAPVAQVVADIPSFAPESVVSAGPAAAQTASPAAKPGPKRVARPAPALAAKSAATATPGAAHPTPAMIIALAIDEDGRDWHPGFRDASVKGALIELVPQGHDIKAWSEMVALHTIFTPLSVADFVANWQGELAAADPEAGYLQTTGDDGSITVEYESVAFREKGIRRFMRGADGIYMLAYHTRPQAVDQAAYARWGNIIAGASLEANR